MNYNGFLTSYISSGRREIAKDRWIIEDNDKIIELCAECHENEKEKGEDFCMKCFDLINNSDEKI